MASLRIALRSSRVARSYTRSLSTTAVRQVDLNDRHNDTAPKYRKYMMEKPLTPHLTNTTSTIANEFPSVGADKPPADQITSVQPDFIPKDSIPENTERMTGGTQQAKPDAGANAELGVGEIEGGKFKVEPLRRTGEDANTMKARLLYQSRKRGTLESDLLLSTFADANLATMTTAQLQAYDLFLDENDWDIYYWATQTPPPTSHETAEGGKGPHFATAAVQGVEPGRAPAEATGPSMPPVGSIAADKMTDAWRKGGARSGEWAQTVGAFKPAYRPVPARWKNSEILAMLRKHVVSRSAGPVTLDVGAGSGAEARKGGGSGLGMMPELKNFDT